MGLLHKVKRVSYLMANFCGGMFTKRSTRSSLHSNLATSLNPCIGNDQPNRIQGALLSKTIKVKAKQSRDKLLLLSIIFFSLFSSTSVFAVNITLNNTISEIAGDMDIDTCLAGDEYRLGTTASYNGQNIDLLVKITAEDNQYDETDLAPGKCIAVGNGILQTRIRNRGAGTSAYMDLEVRVVIQGTSTPLPVDRITFSAFDLDKNDEADPNSTLFTLTDDFYLISPSRGYIEGAGASNVTYSEGVFGAGYDIKLQGQTSGNCQDDALSPDAACRAGGIAVYSDTGVANQVSSVKLRVQNDNAYGNTDTTNGYYRRLIQISFKELDFEQILNQSTDHGDMPIDYLDASHQVSVFTVLGYGFPADDESSQYSVNADADDTSNVGSINFDDEDGVRIDGQVTVGSLLDMTVGRSYNLDVTSIGTGYLSAWIDLNGDNDFTDPGEKILNDASISSTVAIDTSIPINIPSSNYTGVSYARFRFSKNQNVGPDGAGGDGEVEDYKVIFNPGGAVVGHIYDDLNGNGSQNSGEPNLANINVTITDGIGTETIVQTDPQGNYRADAIRPGTVSVDVDISTLPAGTIQTEGTNPTNVNVTADVDNTEENNGFYSPATVTGSVKDGAGDALTGVTLHIQDNAGTIINDMTGNALTTTSNALGIYTFSNVPAGNYYIVEVDPTGYASQSDSDSSADGDTVANSNTNDNKIPVTATSAKLDSDNNFVDELESASYQMVKSSDSADISAPGTITYTFAFTNTGNVAVTNLNISDANIDAGTLTGCPIVTLAVGATQSCTATRAISQAQIDAGVDLTNTAVPSATWPDGTTPAIEDDTANDNSTSTSVVQSPSYTMAKSSDTPSISAPGTITYTFDFVNTGNVELTNLTVADANIDAGTLTGCPIATLAVGATASCTATRAISQAQINAGAALINTAVPSVTGPDGTTVVPEDDTANDNSTSTSVVQSPNYTMAKSSDTSSISAPGTITYTFDFVNTGNVALTNLTIADANIDTGTLTGCPMATLAVGASQSCTATRAISQTQINVGAALTNTAIPSAMEPDGTTPVVEDDTANDNSTSTSVVQSPSYTMAKSSDTPSISAPGTITYTFDFVNTGNVELTNLTVADANIDAGTLTGCPIATLAVGATASCTATRAISQAQINAGAALINTAVPSVTGPDGTTVVPEDDTANDNSTSTSVVQSPSYTMAKGSDTPSISAPGTITYTFDFVNTGNVELTNLTVADANIDAGTLTGCPIATLAVGTSQSCTATRIISQTQINAGTALTNTAVPSATGPDGTTPVVEDNTANDNSTSTSVNQSASYTMKKTSDSPNISAPGTITYNFEFVNTGNVALTNLTIADTNIDAGTLTGCPIATLAVGASQSCTAMRAISQAQINAGAALTNTAVPSATGPDGTTAVPEDDTPNDNSTSTTVTQNPSYTMAKSSDTPSISAPGTITYIFDFVNTGNVVLTNLTVADVNIDAGTLTGCPIATLAVGASQNCTATRVITQAQINAGGLITNTATPSATAPDGSTPVAEDDTANDNSTSTTINQAGYAISGRVFKDADMDGVNDNTEAGISGLPIVLRDSLNGTCVSTRTDGQGNYRFLSVPNGNYRLYEASREATPVPQVCSIAAAKDPAGYRSTTANVLDEFTVANLDVVDKDFGDIYNPTFAADQSGTLLPGNVEFYPHTFTAAGKGLVSFSSANSALVSDGWTSVIHVDSDCNGKISAAEANLSLTAISVNAGVPICIVNKVFVANNVAGGERVSNIISADFNFNNNVFAGVTTLKVTDISTVAANDQSLSNSKLTLRKTVQNLDAIPVQPETETQNQAQPGQTLRYRVYYRNAGTGPITDLVIKDVVPEFTTLSTIADCNLSKPASLSVCNSTQSGNDIEWTFGAGDTLKGGEEGVVSFDVIVD